MWFSHPKTYGTSEKSRKDEFSDGLAALGGFFTHLFTDSFAGVIVLFEDVGPLRPAKTPAVDIFSWKSI